MTDLVPAGQIENIVGARRHPFRHIARGVTPEDRLYILHPDDCRARHADLRDCPWSQALDRGAVAWLPPGVPMLVNVRDGQLITAGDVPADYRIKESNDE